MTSIESKTGLKFGSSFFSKLFGPLGGYALNELKSPYNDTSLILLSRKEYGNPKILNESKCPGVKGMVETWANSGGSGNFFMGEELRRSANDIFTYVNNNKPKIGNLYLSIVSSRNLANLEMIVNFDRLSIGFTKIMTYGDRIHEGKTGYFGQLEDAYGNLTNAYRFSSSANSDEMVKMSRLYLESDNFINDIKTYSSDVDLKGIVKEGNKIMHEIRQKYLSYNDKIKNFISSWFIVNISEASRLFVMHKRIVDSFIAGVPKGKEISNSSENLFFDHLNTVYNDINKIRCVFKNIYTVFEILDALNRGSRRFVIYSDDTNTQLYKSFFETMESTYITSNSIFQSLSVDSKNDCLDLSSLDINMVIGERKPVEMKEEKKEEKAWWKFWGSNCIRIGDKEIDYLSGPESLTFFQGKNSKILLFGDSYLSNEGICPKCTEERKCAFMDDFLNTWENHPKANGDFFFESKKFFNNDRSDDIPKEMSGLRSEDISKEMSGMPSSMEDASKYMEAKHSNIGIRRHYIDIRGLPNINAIFNSEGLSYVHDTLHNMILEATPQTNSKNMSDDVKTLHNLCDETKTFFKANEYDAKQLTALLGMYIYSDNFVDEMTQVIPSLSKAEMARGTSPVVVNRSGITLLKSKNSSRMILTESDKMGSVHKIRKQILKLDATMQKQISSWFNNTVEYYVNSYIKYSAITPKLIQSLTESSSKEDVLAAMINFKKCTINMLRMDDILMDVYAISRMLKMMMLYSSKNIIVYAGGYHVETYRDFFRRYLDMKYITAPKSGPRCLDLSEMDIELVPA